MKKRSIYILLWCILICLIVACYLSYEFNQRLKEVHTYDTMGIIDLAIGDSLTLKSWQHGYNPVQETFSRFPYVKIKNGLILDGWGRPIQIGILRLPKSFSIKIRSAGEDGKFGTPDDCVVEGEYMDSTEWAAHSQRL